MSHIEALFIHENAALGTQTATCRRELHVYTRTPDRGLK